MAKRVARVGGTGNLGRSVAISLHKNPEFEVRVLSRDSQGPKAKALSDIGIPVAAANSWNKDALLMAFEGCWGLFMNIDSDSPEEQWKAGKKPTEFDMGKGNIDTAVHSGIKHIIHASLPFASELTKGQVQLISFDGIFPPEIQFHHVLIEWPDKARTSQYMFKVAEQGKISTATAVNAGWFLENGFDPKYIESFGGFAMAEDEEGYITWKTPPMGNEPDSVPWLSVADDYGDIVHGVFLEPERWNDQFIDAVSESMGFRDLTGTFQKVTGKRSRFVPVVKGNLTAANVTKTQEVNGLFDLMHALKGCFFNGKPTEHENAKLLKAMACAATGRDEELVGVEEFFRRYA